MIFKHLHKQNTKGKFNRFLMLDLIFLDPSSSLCNGLQGLLPTLLLLHNKYEIPLTPG